MQVYRPRRGARAVERHRHRPALNARLPRTGREGDSGARLTGAGEERQRGCHDGETATHEARQGSIDLARYPFGNWSDTGV